VSGQTGRSVPPEVPTPVVRDRHEEGDRVMDGKASHHKDGRVQTRTTYPSIFKLEYESGAVR